MTRSVPIFAMAASFSVLAASANAQVGAAMPVPSDQVARLLAERAISDPWRVEQQALGKNKALLVALTNPRSLGTSLCIADHNTLYLARRGPTYVDQHDDGVIEELIAFKPCPDATVDDFSIMPLELKRIPRASAPRLVDAMFRFARSAGIGDAEIAGSIEPPELKQYLGRIDSRNLFQVFERGDSLVATFIVREWVGATLGVEMVERPDGRITVRVGYENGPDPM